MSLAAPDSKSRKAAKDKFQSFAAFLFLYTRNGLRLHSVVFVRNGQFLSSFSTTCCQYSAAVCSSHSLTETVFVLSLSVRGLKCSFHCYIFFYVIILTNSGCKNRDFFQIKQEITLFPSKVFAFFTDLHYFCTRKPMLTSNNTNINIKTTSYD